MIQRDLLYQRLSSLQRERDSIDEHIQALTGRRLMLDGAIRELTLALDEPVPV